MKYTKAFTRWGREDFAAGSRRRVAGWYRDRLREAPVRLWSESRPEEDVHHLFAPREAEREAADDVDDNNHNGRDSVTSGTNIYAQKLNSLGNKQWLANDVRVNTDLDSIENQYKPAVAMAANGVAVFAWEDYRNRNPDIYAQSFNASGASPPLWGGDVPLIEIDRFYYVTGTAESDAVDTLAGDIVAAESALLAERPFDEILKNAELLLKAVFPCPAG